MPTVFGRFYSDASPSNPTAKNAVYLRGLTPPIWVAVNDDQAKEAVTRLNAADRSGRLVGENYEVDVNGEKYVARGWNVDDLIGAIKGGELSRDAIRAAGTLVQAIAKLANGVPL